MSTEERFISIGMMAGTAHEKYRELQRGCCETWVMQCPKVYFFCGNHHEPEFEMEMVSMTKGIARFIHLDTAEDYESAFYKQFLGLAWMMENTPAQWYAIYGSDNYVIYDKVVETLKKISIEGPVMVGGTIQHRILDVQVPFNIGGGGIYLNHQAAVDILSIFKGESYHEKAIKLTETWFSLCNRLGRPDYKPACDLATGYYGWSIDIPIVGIRGFYPIDYQGTNKYNAKFSFDPNGIIVCHFMSRQQMLDYDKIRTVTPEDHIEFSKDLIDKATKDVESVLMINDDSFKHKIIGVKNIYIHGNFDGKFVARAKQGGSNVVYILNQGNSIISDLVYVNQRNYGSLRRTLENTQGNTSKILIHGTTRDPITSDIIRLRKNVSEMSKELDIPIKEITKGILPAISHFLELHKEWRIEDTSDQGDGMYLLTKDVDT